MLRNLREQRPECRPSRNIRVPQPGEQHRRAVLRNVVGDAGQLFGCLAEIGHPDDRQTGIFRPGVFDKKRRELPIGEEQMHACPPPPEQQSVRAGTERLQELRNSVRRFEHRFRQILRAAGVGDHDAPSGAFQVIDGIPQPVERLVGRERHQYGVVLPCAVVVQVPLQRFELIDRLRTANLADDPQPFFQLDELHFVVPVLLRSVDLYPPSPAGGIEPARRVIDEISLVAKQLLLYPLQFDQPRQSVCI